MRYYIKLLIVIFGYFYNVQIYFFFYNNEIFISYDIVIVAQTTQALKKCLKKTSYFF